MATISKEGKTWRVQFSDANGTRKTIRLGIGDRRAAEAIRVRVERLIEAKALNQPITGELLEWVKGLPPTLAARLGKAGLIEVREAVTLQAMLDGYLACRPDVRPLTRRNLMDAARKLVGYFDPHRPVATITEGDANEYAHHLFAKLAPNTARRLLGRAKQYFAHAVRKGFIDKNPFGAMRSLHVKPNRERDCYVGLEESRRVLEALPSAEWRALFCLARFAGLRVPSEIVELTWGDVNWDRGLLAVRATKTAREGRGWRQVPLFPEVRQALTELFEQADEGQTHMFRRLRQAALGPQGIKNANLRTQFERYILKAGVKPWPKLFSNLRRSAAIDLATKFPAFAVTEWMGHSQAVSEAFYLRMTPELEAQAMAFTRLNHGENEGQNPTQNPTQQLHE